MDFPVYLGFGALRVHPHLVFEVLAYAVGFRWFLMRRRHLGDALTVPQRATLVAAAILGAAVGSKVLAWLNDPFTTWDHRADLLYLMGGKTIVGGLLGGLLAVEATKARMGVRIATGDLYAAPLALGMAVGRVGCFLTGLPDHTYGVATGYAWGVDFGDGVPRHPTQLYEILFLLILLAWVLRLEERPHRAGDVFKTFLAAYLTFRLAMGFLQPFVPVAGLSAIQWACLAGLVYYARDVPRLIGWRREVAHHA